MKKINEFLDFLRTKDKRALMYLAMTAALGIFLLMLGNGLFFNPPEDGADTEPFGFGGTTDGFDAMAAAETDGAESVPVGGDSLFIRERELEQRLEEAFALVEDVGKVRVLVNFSPERETVYAKDTDWEDSVTRETDSQGGSRETHDRNSQEETIMLTDSTGTDRPLVLREIERKIEGAVIIAEGGDSVFVKEALTKAACTVLGIEANKVQVLKMKI